MRRKEREITDIGELLAILQKCTVCRLALANNNRPYVVPLNYGYRYANNRFTLYFHSAREGKKIDMIKKNNFACFEVDCDTALIEGKEPCQCSYAYKSIVGFGQITIVEERAEKTIALNELTKQQTGKEAVYEFTDEQLDWVLVFKLDIIELSGKQKTL